MADRRGLHIVLALFLFFSLGYSVLMPIWEAPDEPAHFNYVRHITLTGQLPGYAVTREAGQPPLYYLLASVPLSILARIDESFLENSRPPAIPPGGDIPSPRRFNWTEENYRALPGPLALRWVNIAVGLLAVLAVQRGMRLLFPDHAQLMVAGVGLYALNPQFLHLSAAVTNDTLANLLGAVCFWQIVRLFRHPPARIWIAGLGLFGLLTPFLVKFTAVPAGLALSLASAYQLRDLIADRRRRIIVVAMLGVVALALPAIVFLTPLGERLLFELDYRLLYVRPDLGSESILNRLVQIAWTYWGRLGWVRVDLPLWIALLFSGLTGIGLAAALWTSWQHRRDPDATWLAKRCLWLMLLLTVLALARNYMATFRIQGRFIFPEMAVIAAFTVYGWQQLAGRWQIRFPALIVLALSAANLVLWFLRVIPIFYQPFLD
jgi:hypothetical protein